MAAAKSDISISHEAWGIAETVCSFRDKIGDAWYDDEVFPAIFRPRCDAGKSRFVVVTGRFELVCVVLYKVCWRRLARPSKVRQLLWNNGGGNKATHKTVL
jgi:hypothetical protein